jgi:DNA polymerase-1
MDLTPEQKAKLYGFLHNMKTNGPVDWKKKTNSNILLVDGTNTFIRCWCANPSMDENGNHTGGVVGFLKSVGYAIKLLCPSRVIVVFDGLGGSYKRRKIFPQYKENRKGKVRLNRAYEEMSTPTTEEEQMRKQFARTLNYLSILPINMLSIDHVEADDVIAYLATDYFKESDKVYIMSSDKDFLQLCTDNVCVYSPTKKRIYGPAEVLAEYQIHPNNFVLFRAMDGDDSDNIDGIEGAGPKTIVKQFPWLSDDKPHQVDELVSHAVNLRNKYKVMENVASNKSLLERNVALMQLRDTALTTTAQLHCNECLATKKIPRLDKGAFFKLIREDLLDSNLPNHTTWVDEVFGPLDGVTRSD